MGVSEDRQPLCSTLDCRILTIRTPKEGTSHFGYSQINLQPEDLENDSVGPRQIQILTSSLESQAPRPKPQLKGSGELVRIIVIIIITILGLRV